MKIFKCLGISFFICFSCLYVHGAAVEDIDSEMEIVICQKMDTISEVVNDHVSWERAQEIAAARGLFLKEFDSKPRKEFVDKAFMLGVGHSWGARTFILWFENHEVYRCL
ncbi:hypothetical protein HN446_02900 [bacterium]|jgi:hypothetical protein|nr:hypothetical protein [bacterium]